MSVDMISLRKKLNLELLLKIGLAHLFLFISLSNGAGYFPESRYLFFGGLAILSGLWVFKKGFLIQRFDQLLLVLLFVAALSMVNLVNLHASLDALLLLSAYFFFFWIVRENFNSKNDINLLLGLMVITATLLAIYGIYQHMAGFDALAQYAAERDIVIGGQSRVFATFISPNALAGYLALVVPLNIFLFLDEKIAWKKTLLVISSGVMGCCIVLTYSRGGCVALFVAILTMVLLMSKKRKKQLLSILAILAIIVFLGCFLAQYFSSPSTAAYEGFTTSSGAKTSFGGRTLLWRGALTIAKTHPFLGSGIGTFSSVYSKYQYGGLFSRHAHNTYLEILAETGFLGFLLFIVILYKILRRQFEIATKAKDKYFKDFGLVLLAASLGFVVHNFADFVWHIPIIGLNFWILAGFTFAIKKTNGEYEFSSCSPVSKKFITIRKTGAVLIVLLGILIIIGPYRAALFAERASDLSRNEKNNEALQLLEEAVKLDPLDGLHRTRLADLSFSTGQNDIYFIREQTEIAVALEPHNAYYRAKLAEFYFAERRVEKARKEYEKAKELYPLSPHYPLQLGQFYMLTGETDKALKEFKYAISLEPYYDIWYSEKPLKAISNAHLQLGNIYAERNDLDKAINEYEEALGLNPDLAPAYYNLGYIYQSEGLYGEAIANYKRTIELQPDYSPAHYSLGILYEEIGEIELAIIQFKEALKLDSGNVSYREKLYEFEEEPK